MATSETFGYAAAKACWPKSKRISVLTFDRRIPYSRRSMIDVVHPGGESWPGTGMLTFGSNGSRR